VRARATFGGVDVLAELQLIPRLVKVQGIAVTLSPPNANVVLVDDVDTGGNKFVASLRIDPSLPDGDALKVEQILRRSPEIVSFLRCDVRLEDERARAMIERSCALIGWR
jgi:hypothetical protein